MKTVAVVLALLVSFQCAAGFSYTGFVRTSGEKFVDDNCKEFVPLGMNTYVGPAATCYSAPWLSVAV